MSTRPFIFALLTAAVALFFCPSLQGDDFLIASGMKLKSSHREYIENRVKRLRDGHPTTRFSAVQYLIRLDRTALPFLVTEVKENSNPMLVRCANMALSEIGGPEAVAMLETIAASSRHSRDERITAALGLGKQEKGGDTAKLRPLIEPRENRALRKAAALALARRKDTPSARRLLKMARAEREGELASIFLLSACMIGGEDVMKEMAKLFKSLKNRRPVMALCAGFFEEPILLPALLKYGARDKKMHAALAVSLGRYRSPQAAALLDRIILGGGPAAADALYSIGYQEEELARKVFENTLRSREPELRVHSLYALADAEMAGGFVEAIREALKDPEPSVRSAAALSLLTAKITETPALIAEALKTERHPLAASDMLLVLGLAGGSSTSTPATRWAERAGEGRIVETAVAVLKTMNGKLDLRILEEMVLERLSELSAAWHYRFRDRVMEKIFWGLELDRIMRKNKDSSPDAGGDSGGDTGDAGGGDGGDAGGDDSGDDSGGEGGEGSGSDDTVDDGVSGSADDIIPPPGGSSGSGGGGPNKRFDFHYEVVEWDLLTWFQNYPYFPETFFKTDG